MDNDSNGAGGDIVTDVPMDDQQETIPPPMLTETPTGLTPSAEVVCS